MKKYDPVVGGAYEPVSGTTQPADNLVADPKGLDRAYTMQMKHDRMPSTYVVFGHWNSENDNFALTEAYRLGRSFCGESALELEEDPVARYLLATMIAEEMTKP